MRLEGGAVWALIREVLRSPEAVAPVGKGRGAEYRPGYKEALLSRDSEPLHLTQAQRAGLLGEPPATIRPHLLNAARPGRRRGLLSPGLPRSLGPEPPRRGGQRALGQVRIHHSPEE